MITIKKIRIKNFRSIVDETIDLADINFFVGKMIAENQMY